jgi:hypothetical protein
MLRSASCGAHKARQPPSTSLRIEAPPRAHGLELVVQQFDARGIGPSALADVDLDFIAASGFTAR